MSYCQRCADLEAKLRLHAGDTLSLSGEIEDWKERAIEAEARVAAWYEILVWYEDGDQWDNGWRARKALAEYGPTEGPSEEPK